ncbi:MAG: diaminopimelate decarboxylase [Elusimicrobiota bacterium]|nr:diaminopimelate decarboxylase [Endomicrobiia bacterium]MDW8166233.1 diaminopimelate decarboxylase [Elusimicrobiota bacterium]
MLIVTPKLKYINGQLYLEEVEVKKIIEKFSTPIYVYSKNQIIENFKEYKEAFGDRSHLICYAMKANSNCEILRIIKELSGGVDVTTGGELFRALKAGISPKKIVYAGVGKTKEELLYAIENKILLLNIESADETKLLNYLANTKKTKLNIAIRINPEVNTHTLSYISTGEEGTKFGIPISEAVDFVKYIIKNCKNLKLVGLHFHIGSQICTLQPFIEATKKVCNLVRKINLLGIRLKYLDIGGGLGIRYKNENPPTAKQLIKNLLKYIPKDLTVICEPGRYIVGNAGILVSKVLYHKSLKNKNFLIVDASMTDLIRPSFYGAYHNIIPVKLSDYERLPKKYYDIVGPVCETSDFLGKKRKLPDIPNNEYLVVETAGAYGFVMSSNYNSRLRPAEVMVDKDKFYLIRKAENYEDLIRKECKI